MSKAAHNFDNSLYQDTKLYPNLGQCQKWLTLNDENVGSNYFNLLNNGMIKSMQIACGLIIYRFI